MVLGDTIVSSLDWPALTLGKIPPPAIGAPWGRAETRRASLPQQRTRDGMATARQQGVAQCPYPVQHLCPFLLAKRQGVRASFLPKDNLYGKALQASS